jgi:hypothetical protein
MRLIIQASIKIHKTRGRAFGPPNKSGVAGLDLFSTNIIKKNRAGVSSGRGFLIYSLLREQGLLTQSLAHRSVSFVLAVLRRSGSGRCYDRAFAGLSAVTGRVAHACAGVNTGTCGKGQNCKH